MGFTIKSTAATVLRRRERRDPHRSRSLRKGKWEHQARPEQFRRQDPFYKTVRTPTAKDCFVNNM